jgi:hypothetical protein
MKSKPDETLDEELKGLSRDLTPPDLWPTIERQIEKRPRARRARWLAYAATVVGLCLAGSLAWIAIHSREPEMNTPTLASQAPSASIASAFAEPRDAAYVVARAAIEKTFNERLALLDQQTRGDIEKNLAKIRSTREDLRAALESDPDSSVLQELLESTWHDEFDLYDDVVRTTQPSLARI